MDGLKDGPVVSMEDPDLAASFGQPVVAISASSGQLGSGFSDRLIVVSNTPESTDLTLASGGEVNHDLIVARTQSHKRRGNPVVANTTIDHDRAMLGGVQVVIVKIDQAV